MKQVLLSLGVYLVVASLATAGEFEDGLAAYERRDYANAFAKFSRTVIGAMPTYDEWI